VIPALLMILGPMLGVALTGLLGFAVFTYIRRSWQVIRSEQFGSVHHRILDELDQVRAQNHMLLERLDRIEAALGTGGPKGLEGLRDSDSAEDRDRGAQSIPPPGRGDHGVLPK
jgi:hypothetical protein